MEFWYHMYGAGMGDLNVYTQYGNTSPKLLWSMSDDQGDVWLRGRVHVDAPEQYWVSMRRGFFGGGTQIVLTQV